MFLKVDENEIKIWLKKYFKKNNLFSLYIKTGFYSGCFITSNKNVEEIKKVTGLSDFIQDTRFIKKDFPFDKNIISKSNYYKINNLELLKLIIHLETMSFKIKTKIISKLDYQGYLITVYKNNEKILEFKNKKNEVNKNIYKLLKKEIIMSKEKENYIIDEVTKRCEQYDIDLKNYQYRITEVNENVYEVELEHKDNENLILIKNIKLNKDNIIINIGENKGFVL